MRSLSPRRYEALRKWEGSGREGSEQPDGRRTDWAARLRRTVTVSLCCCHGRRDTPGLGTAERPACVCVCARARARVCVCVCMHVVWRGVAGGLKRPCSERRPLSGTSSPSCASPALRSARSASRTTFDPEAPRRPCGEHRRRTKRLRTVLRDGAARQGMGRAGLSPYTSSRAAC